MMETTTSEPDRRYGNSLHGDLREGKRLYLTPADISRLLTFCAHHRISSHALPNTPSMTIALMSQMDFDTADSKVYENVLRKVLGWIQRHVNTQDGLLKGWVWEEAKTVGRKRGDWLTSWRVKATKWLEEGAVLMDADGKEGRDMELDDEDGGTDAEWTPLELHPWVSLEQVVRSAMEMRAAAKQSSGLIVDTSETATPTTFPPLMNMLVYMLQDKSKYTEQQALAYLESAEGQKYVTNACLLAHEHEKTEQRLEQAADGCMEKQRELDELTKKQEKTERDLSKSRARVRQLESQMERKEREKGDEKDRAAAEAAAAAAKKKIRIDECVSMLKKNGISFEGWER